MTIRVNFDSSTLASASYDPLRSQLHLEFRDGARYTYAAVVPTLFLDLLSASSKGKFFNQYIRSRFSYARLADEN
jgi:KTSC domain